MNSQHNNQCAIITGGSKGIGRCIAKKFADNGINIILNYNNSQQEALQLQKELKHVKVLAIKADVRNFEQCKNLINEAYKHFGQIDILVNNAGIINDCLMLRMSEQAFDDVINTNLKGCFNCSRHAIPFMIKQKRGRIINISSVIGINGNIGQANYAASKAGIIGLTKSLSRELGSRNITVNAVAPGFITTDMTEKISENQKQQILEQICLRRLGKGEDVASLVYFLSSKEASYITGQVLCVDGGLTL